MACSSFVDVESDGATSPKEANGEVRRVRRTRSRSGSARRAKNPRQNGDSADGAASPGGTPAQPKKKKPKQKVVYFVKALPKFTSVFWEVNY